MARVLALVALLFLSADAGRMHAGWYAEEDIDIGRPSRGGARKRRSRNGGATSYYTSTQLSCKTAENKCEELVEDTIGGMECKGFADIDKCISAVLAPNP